MTYGKKQIAFWLISFLITLLVAIYQRMTGPSHPLKGQEEFAAQTISYKLPRSAISGKEMKVTIKAPNASGASLHYRRLNSTDKWNTVPMSAAEQKSFSASIPSQPPAGKIEYKISLSDDSGTFFINHAEPIIARFRGHVPTALLILHIFFMFASLLFASRCAFSRWDSFHFISRMVWATSSLLILGGFFLGPIVQKFAFGYFWTGFPLGTDLTDNKTLFIFIIWVITLVIYKKKPYILSLAAILTLLIYLIPHSLLGSELDYQTGQHKNVTSSQRVPVQIEQEYHRNVYRG